jgi:hypothetical protein
VFLPFAVALAAQTAGSSVVVTAIDSATKLPIPGVSVTVLSAENVSDKTGRAGVVTSENVPPGAHRIALIKQGCNDTMADLRVKPGGATERLTGSMDAPGEISGAVVDEDDAPLRGVLIYFGGRPKQNEPGASQAVRGPSTLDLTALTARSDGAKVDEATQQSSRSGSRYEATVAFGGGGGGARATERL